MASSLRTTDQLAALSRPELRETPARSGRDLDEWVSRNVDVISKEEQATLRSMRLLVAGCGSVGGSVVEPLVRLGVGALVLADPEPYELSNINRQACFLADIGRSKAEVLAERATSINPYIETRVYANGLRDDNIEAALTGVSVVFDGIDAGMSPWEKYALHERACSQKIPVLAGIDFGGKAVVYVFDYRKKGARPFFGKASAEAHRERRFAECLKWLGYTHFPADFLPIISDRVASGKPWPQVSYCVQAMGAIGTRTILDVAMRRSVPKVVSFDTHMKGRPATEQLKQYARLPVSIVNTYRAVRRPGRAKPPGAPVDQAQLVQSAIDADPVLRRTLEAMRLSPSPHNSQPWRFTIASDRQIVVSLDAARALPIVDPERKGLLYSLGCAIEAAAAVADFEFRPGAVDDPFEPNFCAGVLRLKGLRNDVYLRNSGLLEQRSTNRRAYFRAPVPRSIGERCAALAKASGLNAVLIPVNTRRLKELTQASALEFFRRPEYVAELLAHLRLSKEEARSQQSGMTANGLALGWGSVRGMKLMRARRVRELAASTGIARVMAQSAANNIENAGGYLLLTTSDTTNLGRLTAGRAMMRVWLELTSNDIDCQPVDFPISNQESQLAILEMFDRDCSEQPVALLRVGRAVSRNPSESLRLPLTASCRVRYEGN